MAIEINNTNLFGKIIADALAAVDANSNITSAMKIRWVNAISKATAQIEDNGAWMTWQENDTLLIWSDNSNEIYETNGVCQCPAYLKGFPCWHKAAKQLIKNYIAALLTPSAGAVADGNKCFAGLIEDYVCKCNSCNKKEKLSSFNNAPYLKPNGKAKPMAVGGMRI